MSASQAPADPLIGTRIDSRYLVRGVLGRGGMGIVYEGVHEQLGREVAIKVLSAGMANDKASVQRFLREARTASQLTHGNIVDVSDLGKLPDGRPYLVMAKLHGRDLCTLLYEQGRQSPGRTAELLRGAAAALDLIHAKGYVHRDVKPENLMHVIRQDGSEAVLLLDFGIVGLLAPDSERLTQDGSLFGTPAYLAPEVIRGCTPDRLSDLYALATVAFELMTGRLPFLSNNPFELMQAKMAYDAPRMEAVSAREFPQSVERVIAAALSRNPQDRHASAGEFVDALEVAAHLDASQVRLTAVAVPEHAPVEQSESIELPARRGVSAAHESDAGDLTGFRAFGAPMSKAADNDTSEPERDAASAGAEAVGAADSSEPLVVGAGSALEVGSVGSGVLGLFETQRLISNPQSPTYVMRELAAGEVSRFTWRSVAVAIAVAALAFDAWFWLSRRPASEAAREARAAAHVAQPEPPPTAAVQVKGEALPAVAASGAVGEPVQPIAAQSRGAVDLAAQVQAPAPAAPPQAPTSDGKAATARAARAAARPALARAESRAGVSELIRNAQTELVKGHLGAAAKLYSQATQLDPHSAAAFRGLGLVNERLGNQLEAASALKRAIALAPADPNNARLDERVRMLEARR